MARSVPAVVRALDVLELFLNGQTNLSAPDVATALGLPRTTVHELLATLVDREYVERLPDNTHRFRLGLRVFELGNTYAEALDVVRDGQSVVDEVAARCGETCQLAVLDGRDVVYVAKADGSHDLRVQTPVGRRFAALRTAAGRVLLAHLPWTDLERRFPVRQPGAVRPVAPVAGHQTRRAPMGAVVTRRQASPEDGAGGPIDAVTAENARLRRDLAAINQRGVGSDPGGTDSMVRSVAAAIRDHLGHVVAAVEISVPVSRWDPQRFATLEGLARRAAARASARLGYRPPRVNEAPAPVAAASRTRRPMTTSRLDARPAPVDPSGTRTGAPWGSPGQPPRGPGGSATPPPDAGRGFGRHGEARVGDQGRSGLRRPGSPATLRGMRPPLAGPRLRQLPTLPNSG